MNKVLFWVVIILGALILVRMLARKAAGKGPAPKVTPSQPASQAEDSPSESMVRCAHCGVHLPRSEATLLGDHSWCSSEHARLGPRRQS